MVFLSVTCDIIISENLEKSPIKCISRRNSSEEYRYEATATEAGSPYMTILQYSYCGLL